MTKQTEKAGDVKAPAKIKPATTINPSGAPDQIVPDVDMTHPAVDANPREGTTTQQNRIDFNDPRKPGSQVVVDSLAQKD